MQVDFQLGIYRTETESLSARLLCSFKHWCSQKFPKEATKYWIPQDPLRGLIKFDSLSMKYKDLLPSGLPIMV